jgi:hypothetical protein
MTELYHEYTVRSLMAKTDLTYERTYGLIRRMKDKNLITDIKKTNEIGLGNAKRYGLLMDPVQFLREERSKTPRRHRPQVFSTTRST